MKNLKTLFFALVFFSITSLVHGQENKNNLQIGITGLPIIYLGGIANTSTSPIKGLALYTNIGWMKNKNVVGFRPFWGLVNDGLEQANQRINSAGTNVYYRRYLNEKRCRFFLDANIGFGYVWYNSKSAAYQEFLQKLNGISFNFAVGPGLNYEIKNGLNFELLVQYLQMRNITSPDQTTVGRTIIPSLGIQKFF